MKLDPLEIDLNRRSFLGLRAMSPKPRAEIGKSCLNLKSVICDACKDACAANAIVRARTSSRVAELTVRADLCTACGDCVSVCPANAIAIEERTA